MGQLPDISSVAFLGANVIYQATNGLLSPGTSDEADRGVLDDAVLMMDVISSYDTEGDEKFQREWAAIQARRQKAREALRSGMELAPEVQEGFRWAELRAQFRALCRAGRFVRQESPGSGWTPDLKGAKK